MPLPLLIDEFLTRHYFKIDKQEAALLADIPNKACICRVYLGCTSADIQEPELETKFPTIP